MIKTSKKHLGTKQTKKAITTKNKTNNSKSSKLTQGSIYSFEDLKFYLAGLTS